MGGEPGKNRKLNADFEAWSYAVLGGIALVSAAAGYILARAFLSLVDLVWLAFG